jgi:hypothetical protein
MTICYFLEDIAHERFLKALVARLAEEQGLSPDRLIHDVRNASGGRGKVLEEFRQFLDDLSRQSGTPDVLVVAVDGDCVGYRQRREEILRIANQKEYKGLMACAVPNPHIERWYLADPEPLQRIAGIQPVCPRYKCQRDLYKQALRDVFLKAGVTPLLGGAEYGEDIAREIDIYKVGRIDTGFKHFVEDLRTAFSSYLSFAHPDHRTME